MRTIAGLVLAILMVGEQSFATESAVSGKSAEEISRWQEIRKQVEARTMEADPAWIEAVDRVIAALKSAETANENLTIAKDAAIAGGIILSVQPIHPVRPSNNLVPELAYGDKMLGIREGELKTVAAELTRNQALATTWKTAAGKDQPLLTECIDHWLAVGRKRQELLQVLVVQWKKRNEPGWYDRVMVIDKFDYPMIVTEESGIRQEVNLLLKTIKKHPEPAANADGNKELNARLEALKKQTDATIAAYQAGKNVYLAIADFNRMMTRETPLCENESEAVTVPEGIPWDLKRLEQPPEFRWIESEGPVRSLLYRGEPYQGKSTDVFAYYATPGTLAGKPDAGKSLPALVLVHGGGDRAFRDWVIYWAKQGYAAIAMDLAGCGPNNKGEYDKLFKPERLLRGGPGQDGSRKFLDIVLPVTDQWPYQAVADVILAHSLLRSFPEVDPDRTGIAGISWGGYLTCISAGVDPRFKAVMPFYGCGYLAENSVWKDMGLFQKLTPDQSRRWTQLWDPSRYASRITAPLFAVTGAHDFAYPLESFAKTYALPKGERHFRITPDLGHGAQFLTSTPEATVFMNCVLQAGPPLPDIGSPRVVGENVEADITASTQITKAQFHYTTEAGPNKTRAWTSVDARIDKGKVSASHPPAGARIGYFTVSDDRKNTVSSEVIVLRDAKAQDKN